LAYPGGGIRSQLMHEFRDAVIKVAKEYDFGFDARSSTDGGIAVL